VRKATALDIGPPTPYVAVVSFSDTSSFSAAGTRCSARTPLEIGTAAPCKASALSYKRIWSACPLSTPLCWCIGVLSVVARMAQRLKVCHIVHGPAISDRLAMMHQLTELGPSLGRASFT